MGKLAAIAVLAVVIVLNGTSVLSAGCAIALVLILTDGVEFPKLAAVAPAPGTPATAVAPAAPLPISAPAPGTPGRFYRVADKQRIVAAVLGKSAILAVGAEGSGKTYVATAVVEELREQGFCVVVVEPASPKQLLLEICEQLELSTTTIEGRAMTIDQLQSAIATHLATNTAILILDDAHLYEQKLRLWFKSLLKYRQPMAVFATAPKRADLFLSLSPMPLSKLPEYAIREIMTAACLEFGLSLSTSELANLQQKAGGNPALARRTIEECYLGVSDPEGASDAENVYMDAAPLFLIVGMVIACCKYFALGLNNPQLYIIAGAGTTIFILLSKLLFRIPADNKRIE